MNAFTCITGVPLILFDSELIMYFTLRLCGTCPNSQPLFYKSATRILYTMSCIEMSQLLIASYDFYDVILHRDVPIVTILIFF